MAKVHSTSAATAIDLICGMEVDPATSPSLERGGQTYYFCCEHCREKFASAPEHEHESAHAHHHDPGIKPSAHAKYYCPMCPGVEAERPGDCPKCGMALERNPAWQPGAKTIYTCPMHPEVRQEAPGNCPICGMALEPISAAEEPEEEHSEARDMFRRFWISAVLTIPVLLLAMGHLIPGFEIDNLIRPQLNQWLQFVLAAPVVIWAGWPFFVRGRRSVRTLHLNMFTLIALGVGAAFAYSVVALVAPGVFPPDLRTHHQTVPVYFEAAAVITALVLLGQWLEARARSRTGAAIKALLQQAAKTARVVRNGSEEEIPVVHVKK